MLAAVWLVVLDIYLLRDLSAGRDMLIVFAIKGTLFIAVAARWLYGLLQMHRLAYYDRITSLPNRALMEKYIPD